MSDWFLVRGLVFANPQPRRPSGKRTVKLDLDEVPMMLRSVVGKAVGVEHTDESVGWVVGTHHNRSNDILVDLLVSTRLPAGQAARKGVMDGTLRGLSFRSIAFLDSQGIRHTSHFPFEISLVREGAVERSFIIFWGDLANVVKVSKSGVSQVFRTPQIMEAASDPEPKRPRVVEPTMPSQEEIKQYLELKSALDTLVDNPKDLASIVQLAAEGIEIRKKTVSNALSGGVLEYAQKHLQPDECDRFTSEIAKMCGSAEKLPVMFQIAASAISNYNALLAKGEGNAGGEKVVGKPAAAALGLPAMSTPPSSEMRVKSDGASIFQKLEENRRAIEQECVSRLKPTMTNTAPADIAAKLAQAQATTKITHGVVS